MRVSIESFFFANFAMNALALLLAGRGRWFFRPARLFTASALGALYALFSFAFEWPRVLAPCMFLLMGAVAFPTRGARDLLGAMLYALGAICFVSSVVRLALTHGGMSRITRALGMVAGGLAVLALGRGMRVREARIEVRMRACVGLNCTQFTALVDTGNLLTEPVSGLPVVIADELALGRDFTRAARQGGFPTREAAYASVGGAGGITCVRPQILQLYRKGCWVSAPEMWLGLYPGRMNRSIHALAPATLLSWESI